MTTPISDLIRSRLVYNNMRFFSTDNISSVLEEGDLEALQEELTAKFEDVLRTLVIDTTNDHNTKGTAKRVAKMFLNEIFEGRYIAKPKTTEFPNANNLDELYVIGPIHVDSSCSHHFAPIVGKLWVGILPTDKVLGLSKFHRLTRWIMRRPQIQEEATIALADELERILEPKGLGIVFTAEHMCCTWRGVEDHESLMTTSVVRGALRNIPALKAEFFELIKTKV